MQVQNTISGLATINGSSDPLVEVLGYWTPGDGGGGLFYWTNSSETVNTGTIFAGSSGRWKRRVDDTISVKWFGATARPLSDQNMSPTNERIAIQAALDFAKPGSAVQLFATHYIDDELVIRKPVTIFAENQGLPTSIQPFSEIAGTTIRLTAANKNAFHIVSGTSADQPNYFQFIDSHVGVFGVNFSSISIMGSTNSGDNSDNTGKGIYATGPTADFHIRNCTFENVVVAFFDRGFDLSGEAYLNNFNNCRVHFCKDGFYFANAKNNLGEVVGQASQTRLFGCEFNSNFRGINTYAATGIDLSVIGCTFANNGLGILNHHHTLLLVEGCSFEDNYDAGLKIVIPGDDGSNVNGLFSKTVIGNKFTNNGRIIPGNPPTAKAQSLWYDIWIKKESTAYLGGGIKFPMLIDGNFFDGVIQSDSTIDQPVFVFGATNSGMNSDGSGSMAPFQLANFAGTNLYYYPFGKIGLWADAIDVRLTGPGQVQSNSFWIKLEPGQSLIILRLESYEIDYSTGSKDLLYGTMDIPSRGSNTEFWNLGYATGVHYFGNIGGSLVVTNPSNSGVDDHIRIQTYAPYKPNFEVLIKYKIV